MIIKDSSVKMGFFGLIVRDTPREVAIPEGFSLTLLMAALDLKTKQGTLMMQPNAEADAFIVCHLNAGPGQAHANLMQELAPEDGPVMFWVEGPGKVHITGRWGYAEGEEEEEGSDCDSDCEEDCQNGAEVDSSEEDDESHDGGELDADARIDIAIRLEEEEAARKESFKRALEKHTPAPTSAFAGTKRSASEMDVAAASATTASSNTKKKLSTAEHKGTSANSKWLASVEEDKELQALKTRAKPVTNRMDPEPVNVIHKRRGAWKVKPVVLPDSASSGSRRPAIVVPELKQVAQQSGILYTDYIVGTGKVPKLGAIVKVTYEGMFPDGKVFDKNLKVSKPLKFRKGNGEVVRGLDHGLEGMRVGGSREIVVPPELG